jgi:hypothetical protein
MLTQSSMIGNRPKVGSLDGEFKNEWMLSHFAWRSRFAFRRRQNLDTGFPPAPRRLHALAAKAVVASNFCGPLKDRFFDFVADALPFRGIEPRPGFERGNLLVAKEKHYPAGGPGKRKVKPLRILLSVLILAWPANSLVEQDAQFGRIEIGPIIAKKVLSHFLSQFASVLRQVKRWLSNRGWRNVLD